MPLPFVNFRPLTAQERGAPFGEPGEFLKMLGQLASNRQSDIQNQYLPQGLEAQLRSAEIANALQGAKVPYAAQMAKTESNKALQDLMYRQQENQWYGKNAASEIGSRNAATELNGLQSQLARQTMPYAIQKAQAGSILDMWKAQHPDEQMPGLAGQLAVAKRWEQEKQDMQPNQGGQIPLRQSMPQQNMQSSQMMQQQSPPQSLKEQLSSILSPQTQQLLGVQQAEQNPVQQVSQNKLNGLNLPEEKDFASILKNNAFSEINQRIASTALSTKRAKASNWISMPADFKRQYLAQSSSMGYDNNEAINAYQENKSIKDLAKERGFNPDKLPIPKYPAEMATLNRIQRANMAYAAIQAVDKDVTEAIAPYSARFADVSPKLISEMIKEKNIPKASKALAGFIIQNELSALRLNASGANVGYYAIKDLTDKAYGTLKTLGISPHPALYRATQQEVGKLIGKMNAAENRSMGKYLSENDEKEDYQQQLQNQQDDQMLNEDLSHISNEQLEAIAGRQ